MRLSPPLTQPPKPNFWEMVEFTAALKITYFGHVNMPPEGYVFISICSIVLRGVVGESLYISAVALPVSLLLLVVQHPVRLLQLVRQQLQVARQLVVGLELLGHEYQVPRGVVHGNITDVESPSALTTTFKQTHT